MTPNTGTAVRPSSQIQRCLHAAMEVYLETLTQVNLTTHLPMALINLAQDPLFVTWETLTREVALQGLRALDLPHVIVDLQRHAQEGTRALLLVLHADDTMIALSVVTMRWIQTGGDA